MQLGRVGKRRPVTAASVTRVKLPAGDWRGIDGDQRVRTESRPIDIRDKNRIAVRIRKLRACNDEKVALRTGDASAVNQVCAAADPVEGQRWRAIGRDAQHDGAADSISHSLRRGEDHRRSPNYAFADRPGIVDSSHFPVGKGAGVNGDLIDFTREIIAAAANLAANTGARGGSDVAGLDRG